MSGTGVTEAGVDALVERLHRDGVAAGREEARKLVEDARAEAAAILDTARIERDVLLGQTRREIDGMHKAGTAALGLAMRDTVLRTREALTTLLADRLGVHVRASLDEPALLAELIGWAARRMTAGGALQVEIGESGAIAAQLDQLADLVSRDLAEQTPILHLDGTLPGITVRREGESLAVELTDETLTAYLFAQLQPRFRKIFDGARLG
jgi:V/A-type H+-transporting ATPase subunit E